MLQEQNLNLWQKAILFIIAILLSVSSIFIPFKQAHADVPETKWDTTVLLNLDYYFPAGTDRYPYTNSPSAIGIDLLFGYNKPLFTYKGEVPTAIKDEEGWKNYKYFAQNPSGRKWGMTTKGSSIWGVTFNDIASVSEEDLHIEAMTVNTGFFDDVISTVSAAPFMVLNGINYVFSSLISFVITAVNIDFQGLLDTVTGGELSKAIYKILLFNEDTNTVSPVLVICIIFYIVSLIWILIPAVKGNVSFKTLGGEFLCLLLSMFICFGCASGEVMSSISRGAVSAAEGLVSLLGTDSNDSFKLLVTKTNDPAQDAIQTQISMTRKPYIDLKIYMQTGYYPDALQMDSSCWGVSGNGSITGNSLNINNGAVSLDNFGYFLVAADSSVNNWRPFNSNGTINSANPDRVVFAIDWLQYVNASTDDTRYLNKVETIYNHFTNPDYIGGVMPMFLLILQNISLLLAVFMAGIFCLVGKVVLVVGTVFMPIIALLILPKQTRKTAKQMVISYVMCFARFLIGLVFINLAVIITGVLTSSSSGTAVAGQVVSIILNFLMFFFAPYLFKQLNHLCEKGDQLDMAKSMSRGMDRYMNNAIAKRSGRLNRRRPDIAAAVETGKINQGLSRNSDITYSGSGNPTVQAEFDLDSIEAAEWQAIKNKINDAYDDEELERMNFLEDKLKKEGLTGEELEELEKARAKGLANLSDAERKRYAELGNMQLNFQKQKSQISELNNLRNDLNDYENEKQNDGLLGMKNFKNMTREQQIAAINEAAKLDEKDKKRLEELREMNASTGLKAAESREFKGLQAKEKQLNNYTKDMDKTINDIIAKQEKAQKKDDFARSAAGNALTNVQAAAAAGKSMFGGAFNNSAVGATIQDSGVGRAASGIKNGANNLAGKVKDARKDEVEEGFLTNLNKSAAKQERKEDYDREKQLEKSINQLKEANKKIKEERANELRKEMANAGFQKSDNFADSQMSGMDGGRTIKLNNKKIK